MAPNVTKHNAEDLLGPFNDHEKIHAPPVVWTAGHCDILKTGARVSVVGSRKATPDGVKRSAKLARLLVEANVVVVSGLAEGIDFAAHTSAIAHEGKTIGVLGTSIDRVYPASSADLQAQMMMDHLVMSQFSNQSATQPWHFPVRNRLMALISDATVIVEAGETSGTVSQGWEAIRLGRPLFILESVANDSALTWPAEMQQYGAVVLSERNFDDLISGLPIRSPADANDAILF